MSFSDSYLHESMGLSARELQEFHSAFSCIDTNNNGMIERREFMEALRAIGERPTENELDKLFNIIEKHKNSTYINFGEFCKFMKYFKDGKEDKRTVLRGAFRKLDASGSGRLNRRELLRAVLESGVELRKDAIDNALSFMENGDICMDYEEFIQILLGS